MNLMGLKKKGLVFIAGGIFLFNLVGCNGGSAKQSSTELKKRISLLKRVQFLEKLEGVKVKEVGEKKVFYEIKLEVNGKPDVIYITPDGKYILRGQEVSVERLQKTIDRFVKMQKEMKQGKVSPQRPPFALSLSKEDMEKLNSLTWIRVGKTEGKRKVVYFITDPKCPFCNRAERQVLNLLNEGKLKEKGIEMRVVLYPLEEIHPGSTKLSERIYCSNKGKGGKERYSDLFKKESELSSPCGKGRKTVKEAREFLLEKKVLAVPAFVFQMSNGTGRIFYGVIPDFIILEKGFEEGKGKKNAKILKHDNKKAKEKKNQRKEERKDNGK